MRRIVAGGYPGTMIATLRSFMVIEAAQRTIRIEPGDTTTLRQKPDATK
jgi:hypothetical protein